MRTPLTLPQGMAYGWWHFAQPLLDDFCFEVEIKAGDDQIPGRYFQLYQGQIGGVGMYLGFQTDIAKPQMGGQGKGLIFSRWKTRSNNDAKPPPGGWIEMPGTRMTSLGSDQHSTGLLVDTNAGFDQSRKILAVYGMNSGFADFRTAWELPQARCDLRNRTTNCH